MIDPNHSRITYLEALKPSNDEDIEQIVCLTYSMDFLSLLSSAISLSGDSSFSEALYNNPDQNQINSILFDKINNLKNKLLVFYDSSQLKVPNKIEKLFYLFEDCLVPVSLLAETNAISSFHPKMWFIVYKNKQDGKRTSKLFVSSRNLTDSVDWDFGGIIECKQSDKENYRNNFGSYIESLFTLAKVDRKRHLSTELFEYISSLKFNIMGGSDVHVYFLDKINNSFQKHFSDKVLNKEKDYIYVVSPFITQDIIKKIISTSKKTFIFTRKDEAYKVAETDFFKINKENKLFVLKDDILIDNANSELHAKLYYFSINGTNIIAFGSANATSKALGEKDQNHELIVAYTKNNYKEKDFLNDFHIKLDREKQDYFEQIKETDILTKPVENKDEEREISNLIKKLSDKLKNKGNVESSEIHIKTSGLSKIIGKYEVFLKPLCFGYFQKIDNTELVFRFNNIVEVSSYFEIQIKEIRRIILIELKQLNKEERNNLILGEYLSNNDNFITFLTYYLQDNVSDFFDCYEESDRYEIITNPYYAKTTSGLFENIMTAMAENPKRINFILERIKKIPNEYKNKIDQSLLSLLEKAAEK